MYPNEKNPDLEFWKKSNFLPQNEHLPALWEKRRSFERKTKNRPTYGDLEIGLSLP